MPAQQDPLANLTDTEAAAVRELLGHLLGRSAHREQRLGFYLEIARRIEQQSAWFWPSVCRNGRPEIIVTMLNGKVHNVELKAPV